MAYFERESSNDQMLEPTITAVNKVFMKLQALLDKLNSLEKELCVDNPQGVSRLHWSIYEENYKQK